MKTIIPGILGFLVAVSLQAQNSRVGTLAPPPSIGTAPPPMAATPGMVGGQPPITAGTPYIGGSAAIAGPTPGLQMPPTFGVPPAYAPQVSLPAAQPANVGSQVIIAGAPTIVSSSPSSMGQTTTTNGNVVRQLPGVIVTNIYVSPF